MTTAGWAIGFYLPDNPNEFIGQVSNFEGWNLRPDDNVVVFSGMFDTEDYMLWYAVKDLPNLDMTDVCINLMLFMEGDPEKPYFNEKYRVHSVKFDPRSDTYIVYAIHEDHMKLMIPLWDYKITSFNSKDVKNGADVLKEIILKNDILGVLFHRDYNNLGFSYQYKNLTFNKFWNLKDVINYICDENHWEWTVKYGDLHLGNELAVMSEARSFRMGDYMVDNFPESSFFMKVALESTPIDVLSNWNNEYKCVWVKHSAGKSGGITKACFVKIGKSIDKKMYVRTLEGIIERNQGYASLAKYNKYPSVGLGKILQDNQNSFQAYADIATTSKDTDTEEVKIPRNIKFFPSEGNPQVFEEIGRTSPYLDNGAGLLFPVAGENPPNSVILIPNGDIESAVLGPFVFGNGEQGFVIPAKNPKDFRLHLPSGWTLYVDENGNCLIKSGASVLSIPTESGTYIKINANGTVVINGTLTKLQNGSSTLAHGFHIHSTGNLGYPVDPCKDNTTQTLGD